ncbi:MAG: hypothetical protein SFV15_24525 [Polyangiaceae bacterium]|nr:hypothetical protein [Polyangiaceae bacterium]
MAAALDPADVRAFASRAWALAEQSKRRYWVKLHGSSRGRRTVELAHALALHSRPRTPALARLLRDDDLAHHVRLKGLIDAAASAFTVR